MSPQPVLVVEHETLCPLGWLERWWREAGVELEVRRPYRGDPLPADLSGRAGMVVLGGSMGANDDDQVPWLAPVKQLVRAAVADQVPTLGVCLGHQLVAVALGGEVHRNPDGQQVGVLDVGWAPEAADDPLLGGVPRPTRAVQWNDDIVGRLPEGAVLLASAPTGEIQADRFAPSVWGVQWHPEAGEAIVRSWTEADRDDVVARGIDVETPLRAIAAAEQEMQRTWGALGPAFAALLTRDRVR